MYVSTTSLFDPSKNSSDPNRYVNADTVPYIVTNPTIRNKGGRTGDYVTVIRKIKLKNLCIDIEIIQHTIIADVGPPSGQGEGSIALARNLGINHDARRGGSDKKSLIK